AVGARMAVVARDADLLSSSTAWTASARGYDPAVVDAFIACGRELLGPGRPGGPVADRGQPPGPTPAGRRRAGRRVGGGRRLHGPEADLPPDKARHLTTPRRGMRSRSCSQGPCS